jgi:hypothetical protein
MGNLKNQAAAAAGALVGPLVKLAEEDWLPTISEHFKNWATWLNSGGAERLYETMEKLAKVLGPIAAAFGAFKIIMWVVGAVAALGTAFAGVWAVVSAVAGLLPAVSSIADFFYVIGSALGIIGASGAVAVGAIVAAVLAVIAAIGILYWKVGWFRDAVNAVAKGLWWLFGETIGGLIIGSIVTWSEKAWHALQKLWDLVKAIGGGIASIAGSIAHAPGNLFRSLGGGGKVDVPFLPFMAGGGTIPVGGAWRSSARPAPSSRATAEARRRSRHSGRRRASVPRACFSPSSSQLTAACSPRRCSMSGRRRRRGRDHLR